MQIKSWFEEFRAVTATAEELEKERQAALANEAQWRADNQRLHLEEDIMHDYANCLMEKELKAMGEHVMKKYPAKKDQWVVAEIVYHQYGRFHLLNNQPAEAVKWFLKALKHKLPYPYNVWEYLAAAYVETGEYEKADLWIKRYVEHYTKEGQICRDTWSNFAKYYLERKMYERALALFLEGQKGEKIYHFDKPDIANAYFGLGEYEKGFQLYEEYLQKSPTDEWAHAEIALAYYNHHNDVDQSEAHYLKSVEMAIDRKNIRKWNYQVYRNLAVIFANEADWDKCFHYLRLHYENRFEGLEAEIFFQIIDNRPPIDDHAMGLNIFNAIRDFENSPLRPGGLQHTEGLVADQPSAEVNSTQQDSDLSGLFDWDEFKGN